MEKMYRGCVYTGTITHFEVQKTTQKKVTFKNSVGRFETEYKTTQHFCWRGTKEECREWLLIIYNNRIKAAQWTIKSNELLIKRINEQ